MPMILTKKDLEQVLTMKEVIDVLDEAFLSYARGTFVAPVRMSVDVKPFKGTYLIMPSYQEKPDGLGVKLVSVFDENIKRNLPTLYSCYVYCDPQTGALLSLMEGSFLTGLRTGAASGLASRYLARKDSRVLCIFGTGYQSGFQLEAMRAVLPALEEVYVTDLDAKRVAQFISRFGNDARVSLKGMNHPDEMTAKADVVVTATTSRRPVFDGRLVKPGTHINAIGAFTPTMQEIDEGIVTRAKVVVDTYGGCLSEPGDILIPIQKGLFSEEKIHSDLAGLVSKNRPGRENAQEITLFKSVGTALEDLATARLAYRRALEKGIGLSFEF